METVAGLATGFIINLSRHGAMVQTLEPPSPGSLLALKCGPLESVGRVAWTRKKRFGVRFDEPVAEDIVLSFDGTLLPPRAEWRPMSATIHILPLDEAESR